MAWEATYLLSSMLLLLLASGEDRGQGQREGTRLLRGQGAGGVHSGALCLGRQNTWEVVASHWLKAKSEHRHKEGSPPEKGAYFLLLLQRMGL